MVDKSEAMREFPCGETCKLFGNPNFSIAMKWVVDKSYLPEADHELEPDQYAELPTSVKDLAVRCTFTQRLGGCAK